jgi:protein SCO1
MNGNKSFPRMLIWGLVLAVGLVVVGFLVTRQALKSRSDLPKYNKVTRFSFTRSDGGAFTDQDFGGKISVVDFIFTNCGSICPTMTGNMTKLYRQFGSSEAVQFVSISVDPENDTPEVLAAYAKDHGVTGPHWVFLNGPLPEVVNLSEHGFLLPGSDLPGGHSSRFVLVDRAGWIRGYYDGLGDMTLLADHVQQLVKEKS